MSTGRSSPTRTRCGTTLTEASFGAIPPAVDVTVRKLLGVDRFVGVAYVIEGALYGTSVVALKADTPDPPREELETFANLAAVSLRRRRAEVELALQTEQVDALFALSGDILGIGDTDGTLLRVNPAWETILGYPVEELEGRPLLGLVHPGRPGGDTRRSGGAGARSPGHRLRQSAAPSRRVLPAHRVAGHAVRGRAHLRRRPRHHRQGRSGGAGGDSRGAEPRMSCAAPAPTTAASSRPASTHS